jgi:cation:H+ antiporter
MIWAVLLIILGFVALILGANWLVEGAASLARKFRVSDLAIGLTIVAFGTSAPELVVSILSSSRGYSEIVLGNIIGSNNFNLFIILGLSGLILPITVKSSTAWLEIPISLFVMLLFFLLANDFFLFRHPVLSRMDGSLFLILFAFFLYYVFRQMRNDVPATVPFVNKNKIRIAGLILVGMTGLVLGGKLVVDNGVRIATYAGVSEKIIGLTIMAAGTSLPELVTSAVAAVKRNSDIAVGNVIGSNIFNVLLILGLSITIRPLPYSTTFNTDMYILLGGTLFLLVAMLTGKRKKLDRWEAGLLLLFYLGYISLAVWKEL